MWVCEIVSLKLLFKDFFLQNLKLSNLNKKKLKSKKKLINCRLVEFFKKIKIIKFELGFKSFKIFKIQYYQISAMDFAHTKCVLHTLCLEILEL